MTGRAQALAEVLTDSVTERGYCDKCDLNSAAIHEPQDFSGIWGVAVLRYWCWQVLIQTVDPVVAGLILTCLRVSQRYQHLRFQFPEADIGRKEFNWSSVKPS